MMSDASSTLVNTKNVNSSPKKATTKHILASRRKLAEVNRSQIDRGNYELDLNDERDSDLDMTINGCCRSSSAEAHHEANC